MKNNKLYVYLGCALFAIALVVTAVTLPGRQKEESARHSSNDEKQDLSKHTENIAKGHEHFVPSATKDEIKKGQQAQSVKQDDPEKDVNADAKEVSVTQYNFHGGSTLAWPVKGNVIINFDMEHLVYFPTLDEYRYSNAIAIAADKDTPVVAGAAGEVTRVEEDTEHGLCVTMQIGPEYEITYGQLSDCKLKVGDSVKRQQEFAKIAKVSPHYAEEGEHLYLQLKRGDDYENPLSYLDFSE